MKVLGVEVKEGDIVWFQWEDHWTANKGGWIAASKIDTTPMLCETVGWVVDINKKGIVTVQAHDGQLPDPFVHGSYSFSPLRMITKIKVMRRNPKIKLRKK